MRILTGALALLAAAAAAQNPPAVQQGAPGTLRIGSVTVQGSFRSRLEAWDWFDGDANNSYAFSGNQFRVSFGQTKERWDWLLEFEAPFLLGLPDDAVAPGAQGQLGLGANYSAANRRAVNAGMVFAKQAFIRLKSGHQSLRLGRFEFADGGEVAPSDPTLAWIKRERVAQRLVGPFGWSHVGRSFDGAHYVWSAGKTNFTLVGALPTRGAFQVDGWGNLNVAFGYASVTRQRTGKKNSAEWRLFGVYYQDWRSVLKTDSRPLALRQRDPAEIRIGSYGGHYLHRAATSIGTFDGMVWAVAQTGRWGRLDHRAAAVAAEGGWQPAGLPALRPWLRAGYFHGSGDEDPLDGKHGTFFQILPTPRPYARMPFFNLENNEDFFTVLLLRPHKSVTIRPEVHALRLANRNDMWYLGGGAFQPWTFGYTGRPSGGNRGLATLYDLSADYNVNPRVTLSGYFGHAAGHSVIRSIYPRGANGKLGYAEVTYRF